MKNARSGMTLFELLIVMMIVGIVYSVGMIALKKENITVSSVTLSDLKNTLASLAQTGQIRMVCDLSCKECRVWSESATPLATVRLKADDPIERYGFDRFGELKKLGNIVTRSGGTLRQECFEYVLYPDGTSSPLILKNDQKYYVYTPLAKKPFVAGSEEALRKFVFDEAHYPLRGDVYYVGQ